MEIKVRSNEILKNIDKLVNMYKKGLLGGEVMPEDSNPTLSKETIENYIKRIENVQKENIKDIHINYGKVRIKLGMIKKQTLYLIQSKLANLVLNKYKKHL